MYNNTYYNPMQTYIPNQRFQPIEQPSQPINAQSYVQPIQQINTQGTLFGKTVESLDVVKAIDIPVDGSTNYFPLTDGSAIVTKKIQMDGKSKITIYKPTDEEDIQAPKYITEEELNKAINNIDLSAIDKLEDKLDDLRDEFKDFKKSKKKDD